MQREKTDLDLGQICKIMDQKEDEKAVCSKPETQGWGNCL